MTTLMQRRTNEIQPMARLRDEFESIFDRFLSRWPTPFESNIDLDRLWDLQVEDGENEAIIRAEIPGFEVDELDVQVAGGVLTIKAEKKQDIEKPNNGGVQERSYRAFSRNLMLPEGIQVEGIEAKYHSGVLEIRLPKSEDIRPKRIPVEG
jgi:HSP20 family protein